MRRVLRDPDRVDLGDRRRGVDERERLTGMLRALRVVRERIERRGVLARTPLVEAHSLSGGSYAGRPTAGGAAWFGSDPLLRVALA
jgi:hypothetical protein